MARGAFRGAASVWLGLVALQVLTTREGSGKVAGAFVAVDSLLRRAMDPNVPAIPDHSAGAAPAAAAPAGVAAPYIPPGFVGPVQPGRAAPYIPPGFVGPVQPGAAFPPFQP